MKKIGLLVLVTILCITCIGVTHSASYTQFEEMHFLEEFKLLSEFTETDYKEYYDKINKRKFSGWNTYTVNENKKVIFRSETLYSYYNNGRSPIEYHYKSKTKEVRQYDIAVSGSLGISNSKNEKTFKNGLTKSLKVDLKSKVQKEVQEEQEFKLKLDPKTKLVYYYYGEGNITNGVASRYLFFIKKNVGGFEIFTVTTHYPKLEILPI